MTVLHFSYARFNFVLVHIFTVFYWFPFLLNNPLNFPWVISTLDAPKAQPSGQCTPINWDAVLFDIGLWAIWWGQHSIMSRERFKKLIGTWGSPIDRPLFGLASCLALSVYTLFWKPISDCSRADFTDLNRIFSIQVLLGAVAVFVSVAFVLSYFWILPTHVFGTDHYIIRNKPAHHSIITGYPYGIVRHPAAAGFLWMFWAFPSYTTNHLFYALQLVQQSLAASPFLLLYC